MKNLIKIVLGILFALPEIALAASTFQPNQGGTGTICVPTIGQVLVGTSGGIYACQATSTLGITSGGSTSPGGGNLQLQYNNNGSFAGTSSPSVTSINATSSTQTSIFSGKISIATTSTKNALTIGNQFSVATSGVISIGFTPWIEYENAFESLIFQLSNSGYYDPRSIIENIGPQNSANGTDDESTFTAEIPIKPYGYNGTDYTDREWMDAGCESYPSDHNCYIESASEGAGSTSPIRIGFWNSDIYSSVDKVPFANYFDPTGAVALGFGTSTLSNPNRYDPTTMLQVSSSTAPLLFSLNSGALNLIFTVSSTTASTSDTLVLSSLTGTQCLHEVNGTVGVTGSDCPPALSGGTTGQNVYWTSPTTIGSEATGTISATNSTLTVTGLGAALLGNVSFGLNLANVNSWSGTQNFSNTTASNATTTNFAITGLANTVLAVDSLGNVVATTTSSGGTGTNYFTNSGATTSLTTGTILQAPTFNATSTTGTSTFVNDGFFGGKVAIGTTSAQSAELTVIGPSTSNSSNFGAFSFEVSTNPNLRLNGGFDASAGINAGYFQAINVGSAFNNLLLEPAGGNLGIGSTTPGSKLSVTGDANIIGNGHFLNSLSVGSANFATFNLSSTKVASGTATLLYLQNLDGLASDGVQIVSDARNSLGDSSVGSILRTTRTNTTNSGDSMWQVLTSNGTDMEPRLTINPTGNIGIGTTSTTATITVQGTSTMSVAIFASSTTGIDLGVDNHDRVLFGQSGVQSLVAGTFTKITTALIDAKTIIMLTPQSNCIGSPDITATTSQSFTVTSTTLTDTCIVGWVLFESP